MADVLAPLDFPPFSFAGLISYHSPTSPSTYFLFTPSHDFHPSTHSTPRHLRVPRRDTLLTRTHPAPAFQTSLPSSWAPPLLFSSSSSRSSVSATAPAFKHCRQLLTSSYSPSCGRLGRRGLWHGYVFKRIARTLVAFPFFNPRTDTTNSRLVYQHLPDPARLHPGPPARVLPRVHLL